MVRLQGEERAGCLEGETGRCLCEVHTASTSRGGEDKLANPSHSGKRLPFLLRTLPL